MSVMVTCICTHSCIVPTHFEDVREGTELEIELLTLKDLLSG